MDPAGVKHLLYGDFKIDDSKSSGAKPENFQVVLYTISGNVVARQSVTNNGRYTFNNIPNGEYNLVVEMEGAEITRMQVRLSGFVKGEHRRDIELEWRGAPSALAKNNPAVISIGDQYERKPANQGLFDKSQEAIKKNDLKLAATLLNQLVSADTKDYQAWTALGLVQI